MYQAVDYDGLFLEFDLEALPLILAVSPVAVIFICVLFLRLPAHICGLAGFLTALIVSITYFNTEIGIAARTILYWLILILPLMLFVAASIFQVLFMERAGAIRRISIALKVLCGADMIPKVIIINIGVAAILAGFGLNPLSILPPLLIALGFTVYASISLPAVGSSALWMFFAFGAPLAAFHYYIGGGQTLDQAGAFFVDYLWPTTLVLALGILYLTGGMKTVFRGFFHSLLAAGVVGLTSVVAVKFSFVRWTGVLAGVGIIVVFLLWQLIRRGKILDRSILTENEISDAKRMPLLLALLPLILTAVLYFLINFIDPLRYFVAETAAIRPKIIPAESYRLPLLGGVYIWILIATLISIPFYRNGWQYFKEAVSPFLKRAPYPVISIGLFFLTAIVMWYSGHKEMQIEHAKFCAVPVDGKNMIDVMVAYCRSIFGEYYAVSGVTAGIRMGFVSGDLWLPIRILTRPHLEAAEDLLKPGGAGIFIAAASAMAASLMIMVNPARLQNAAAVIGHTGYEGRVFRSTLVIAFIIVLVIASIALYLSHL